MIFQSKPVFCSSNPDFRVRTPIFPFNCDFALYCTKYYKIFTHFMEISVVFLYVMFFFTKSTPRMPSCMSKEARWQFFCKCCCSVTTLLTCCLHGGRDNKAGDFADIGMILADFFDGGGHFPPRPVLVPTLVFRFIPSFHPPAIKTHHRNKNDDQRKQQQYYWY